MPTKIQGAPALCRNASPLNSLPSELLEGIFAATDVTSWLELRLVNKRFLHTCNKPQVVEGVMQRPFLHPHIGRFQRVTPLPPLPTMSPSRQLLRSLRLDTSLSLGRENSHGLALIMQEPHVGSVGPLFVRRLDENFYLELKDNVLSRWSNDDLSSNQMTPAAIAHHLRRKIDVDVDASNAVIQSYDADFQHVAWGPSTHVATRASSRWPGTPKHYRTQMTYRIAACVSAEHVNLHSLSPQSFHFTMEEGEGRFAIFDHRDSAWSSTLLPFELPATHRFGACHVVDGGRRALMLAQDERQQFLLYESVRSGADYGAVAAPRRFSAEAGNAWDLSYITDNGGFLFCRPTGKDTFFRYDLRPQQLSEPQIISKEGDEILAISADGDQAVVRNFREAVRSSYLVRLDLGQDWRCQLRQTGGTRAARVRQANFSPSGNRMLTVSDFDEITFWDLTGGSPYDLNRIKSVPMGAIHSADFQSESTVLMRIKVRDTSKGHFLRLYHFDFDMP